ncbi:hypothetical protein KJ786_00540 [Patescibacteria group bacterium]|nr:hypothetical protein [Patescibacteria group bacterium]
MEPVIAPTLVISGTSLKDFSDAQRKFIFLNGPHPGDMGSVNSFTLFFTEEFGGSITSRNMQAILEKVYHIKKRRGKKGRAPSFSRKGRELTSKTNLKFAYA